MENVHMKASLLPDRGVVKVSGVDARKFLNGLFTANIAKLTAGRSCYTALLTAQGKIVMDAIVTEAPAEDGGGFYFDTSASLARTCVDRLNLYRLAAKITIEDLSPTLGVMALWDGDTPKKHALCYRDPRLPTMGERIMLAPHLALQTAADLGAEFVPPDIFEAHRIALGIPQGDVDFTYGDTFPHEADIDQLHGIDFKKGCFVGQEVVQRMERRGTARTRVLPVTYDGSAPAAGTAVTAAEKPIGTIGSSAKGRALALLRLDRADDALKAGHALMAGATSLHLVKPDWVRFAFPGDPPAA